MSPALLEAVDRANRDPKEVHRSRRAPTERGPVKHTHRCPECSGNFECGCAFASAELRLCESDYKRLSAEKGSSTRTTRSGATIKGDGREVVQLRIAIEACEDLGVDVTSKLMAVAEAAAWDALPRWLEENGIASTEKASPALLAELKRARSIEAAVEDAARHGLWRIVAIEDPPGRWRRVKERDGRPERGGKPFGLLVRLQDGTMKRGHPVMENGRIVRVQGLLAKAIRGKHLDAWLAARFPEKRITSEQWTKRVERARARIPTSLSARRNLRLESRPSEESRDERPSRRS
jgi:hypothetical protein